MTDLKCRHCKLSWRVAALTPCAASESGQHEFTREILAAAAIVKPESET